MDVLPQSTFRLTLSSERIVPGRQGRKLNTWKKRHGFTLTATLSALLGRILLSLPQILFYSMSVTNNWAYLIDIRWTISINWKNLIQTLSDWLIHLLIDTVIDTLIGWWYQCLIVETVIDWHLLIGDISDCWKRDWHWLIGDISDCWKCDWHWLISVISDCWKCDWLTPIDWWYRWLILKQWSIVANIGLIDDLTALLFKVVVDHVYHYIYTC